MKRRIIYTVIMSTVVMLLPGSLHAQGFAGEIHSLQSVLNQVYYEMLPLCSRLIGVARGLAAFGALWYIASRVWRHLANAEPIDFYPLLRPFALGMCIFLFPYVIGLMNGVLRPTVTGTAAMVQGSNNAIAYLLNLKEEAIKKTPSWQMYVGSGGAGDRDKWYRYTHPTDADEGMLEGIGNDIRFAMEKAAYNFRHSVKQWMSEILHVLYEAAALCINTLRTFYLIVLAVLGPLVFGFSVFDGLQHTLVVWISRYINVFLWLPIANLFGALLGKIQENMLKVDISQIVRYGDTFFSSTDTAYLIFLVIGIVGYFTVPSVANYIIHPGGTNELLHKASNVFVGTAYKAATTAIPGSGAASMASGQAAQASRGGSPPQPGGSNNPQGSGYMHTKISGK